MVRTTIRSCREWLNERRRNLQNVWTAEAAVRIAPPTAEVGLTPLCLPYIPRRERSR